MTSDGDASLDVPLRAELLPHPSADLIQESDVPDLMGQIRPAWQAKNLIERVRRLLPVDPSSACQRIFNAAVHDLREKVVIAGIDIAGTAAEDHKLPPVERAEDVERYPTAKLLDLAYRMGLLTRPEWRRMSRVYEIRRDLEHEDIEYEAGIEDCLYVFKTCIESVLARDPVNLIRVAEVREVVEAPSPVTPQAQLLEDFERAPQPRQTEILRFLISTALDDEHPDLVRQNAFSLLHSLRPRTRDAVRVELANHLQERLGRAALTDLQARVAQASGVFPYLRRAQRTQYFKDLLAAMHRIGPDWRSHPHHGELLRRFIEVGGLSLVTDDVRQDIMKWLVLTYIGEPGGYGTFGRHREVFYSNSAAPLIREILADARDLVRDDLEALAEDGDVRRAIGNEHVARRFEELRDIVESFG